MAVLAAAAFPLLSRRLRRNTGYVLSAGFLAVGGLLLTSAPTVAAGEAVHVSWDWFPSLGVAFSLRLDGLAALSCTIVLGVGALIMGYYPPLPARGQHRHRRLRPADPLRRGDARPGPRRRRRPPVRVLGADDHLLVLS